MRKFIALAFIPLLLFNIGGYYLWFSALQLSAQKEIKTEIKKGIADKDLTLVISDNTSASTIHWIKPGKEFRMNGEMFDIVRIKKVDQKLYYYCLNDKVEKKIIAAFEKTKSSRKDTEKKLKRTFTFTCYIPSVIQSKYLSTEVHFALTIASFTSYSTDIHSPPPKSGTQLI
jgi:hypothetical protein